MDEERSGIGDVLTSTPSPTPGAGDLTMGIEDWADEEGPVDDDAAILKRGKGMSFGKENLE